MIITEEELRQILPDNDYIPEWCEALNHLLPQYQIDTDDRVAAFISQCAHESQNFTRLSENLNYRAESLLRVFPKYFKNIQEARLYEKKPQAIANRVYANRMGNGDEGSGDGWAHRGRGILQITGKNNYLAFGESIGYLPSDVPDYLETFYGAVQAACWYWETNNLNSYADRGDIKGLTRAINGGYNGLQDRIEKYKKCIEVLTEHDNQQ